MTGRPWRPADPQEAEKFGLAAELMRARRAIRAAKLSDERAKLETGLRVRGGSGTNRCKLDRHRELFFGSIETPSA